MKYIDVDALGIGKANPEVFLNPEYAHGWNSAVEIVLTAPAADVAPVKHGRWVATDRVGMLHGWKCSVCDVTCMRSSFNKVARSPYCPNCGARMMEGNDANE